MTKTKTKTKSTWMRWLRAWLPAVLWMGGIFILSGQSSLPSLETSQWDLILKKTGHFVGFGILTWLYIRALGFHGAPLERRIWLAVGMTALYAASDEFHQSFVPGRHPALTDWMIDMAGALAAALGMCWLLSRRQPPLRLPDSSDRRPPGAQS